MPRDAHNGGIGVSPWALIYSGNKSCGNFRENELSCGKVSVCIDLRLNARIFDQIPVVDQKANAIVTTGPEQQY